MVRPSRTRPASTAPRPPSLPAWGAVCFFLSGAAGLLYEVIWSKQLSYTLGNSLHAVATVVASFLCGLALGARFLGVPLSRRGDGGRIYALLELGIGVLGVVSLPALRALDPLIGQLYRGLGGEGPAFALARVVLLFVLFLPPTALMGATLPVLVAHFETGWLGPALARLYALNTFGAVAGSIAGGFLLLPEYGLMATSRIAAGLNALVAALAWWASSRSRQARPAAGRHERKETLARGEAPASAAAPPAMLPGALSGPVRYAFALLFALSGFAALAFQIAWVRLFGLVFGSSVYSFSAVLGVYLLGLALGSAGVARFMRRGVSLAALGRLQLALATVTALELLVFRWIPERVYDLVRQPGIHWASLFAGEVGMVAVLLIVPCAMLGAVFPAATRLLQQHDGGHAAGFAYAVNTAGTIAGSLTAGFVLIPTLGVQGTHIGAGLLSAAIGLASIALSYARRESRALDLGLAGGVAAVIVALAVAAPRWDPALMGSGSYRPIQAGILSHGVAGDGPRGSLVWRATRGDHVLYYREGLNGSVLVGSNAQGNVWLRVGGKVDASSNDMLTQTLLGLLPGACADSAARTLVVGLGSGFTVAAALAAGAGPTEVIEIERGVVEGSRFFYPSGGNPLDDPRVTLRLGDARTELAHGRGRFGMIISEPSNPWMAGCGNLFTVDFYRQVRGHLDADGVFCQWIQAYEVSAETFRVLMASLLEVFPDAQLFVARPGLDVLIVAMPPGRRLALERLRTPAARRMLALARIAAPEDIAGYYCGPLSALRDAVRGAPLNRDDRPVVEYRAPRDLIAIGGQAVPVDRRLLAMLPFADTPPEGALFAAWSPERWYESRARLMLRVRDTTYAAATAAGARRAGLPALAQRLEQEIEAHERRQRSSDEIERARSLLAAGQRDQGRQALERALAADSTDGAAWTMLADSRRVAGDATGAEAALAHALASTDSGVRAEALLVAGALEAAHQRPRVAIERFEEAQRLAPGLAKSYLFEAKARLQLRDRAGAEQAIRRGLAHAPDDPQLKAALAGFDKVD